VVVVRRSVVGRVHRSRVGGEWTSFGRRFDVDKGSTSREDRAVVNRRVQREHEDALLFYVGELGAVTVKDLQTLFFGEVYPGAPWELFEARWPPAPLSLSPSAIHRLCQRLARDGRLRLTSMAQARGRPRLVASLGEEALLRCRRLRSRRHLLADVASPERVDAALARAALRVAAVQRRSSFNWAAGRDGLALFRLRQALAQAPCEVPDAVIDAALPSPTVASLAGGRGLVREHYRCVSCGYEGAFRQVHKRPDAQLCEGQLRAFLPLPFDVSYALNGRASVTILLVDDGERSVPSMFGALSFLRHARKPPEVWVATASEQEALPSSEPSRSRRDVLASVGREVAGVTVRVGVASPSVVTA
jgi:hypothetical protein